MADLPSGILKLFKPPLTVTDVDLCIPFYFKYGKNTKKGYKTIYTRAITGEIHLEIV